MIKFKFSDREILAPNCWEEVTVEHYINPYFLAQDSMSLLSALSGIDRTLLMNTKEDIARPLHDMVKFMRDDPKGFTKDMPEEFEIMGKKVKIPKDIELERVGQKIMFDDAIAKHQFVYSAIPECIAIYLIPEIYGEFDDTKIEEVSEAILKMPIRNVHPVYSFFLNRLKILIGNGKIY